MFALGRCGFFLKFFYVIGLGFVSGGGEGDLMLFVYRGKWGGPGVVCKKDLGPYSMVFVVLLSCCRG